MAHHPHVRAVHRLEILVRLLRRCRMETSNPAATGQHFPSCQCVHGGQTRRTRRPLQAANFPMIWKTRRGTLDLTRRARVMGILNVTPDSFSDGGRHADPTALDHARRMIAAGADIIDIGGESTRPGALPVAAEDEIARTAPMIAALRAEWDG
jgi:hypothetical protein